MATAPILSRYDPIISEASKKYGVPEQLIKAVIKAESGFNPNARSPAGAQGLMQLMPATGRSLGVTNPFDPYQNINAGTKYLSQQLKAFNGSVPLALSAYNAGAGNVRKYGGIPPFQETQNYVKKIMAWFTGEEIIVPNVPSGGNAGENVLPVTSGGSWYQNAQKNIYTFIALLVLFIVGVVLFLNALPVDQALNTTAKTVGQVVKPIKAVNKVRKKIK